MTQLSDKKLRFYANSKTTGGYMAEEVSAMASELQERRSAVEATTERCGICADCVPQIGGGSGFTNCADAHAAETHEPVAMRWRWKDDGMNEVGDWIYHAPKYFEQLNASGTRLCELLYAAPQPVAVPDERAAFNKWNNDTDCPLAGLTVKQAAWLAWLKRSGTIKSFGNSEQLEPVSQPYTLPDGWKLVPVEPTHDMLNAWLSEVANWRGHVAGYKAMLSAAPQEPTK